MHSNLIVLFYCYCSSMDNLSILSVSVNGHILTLCCILNIVLKLQKDHFWKDPIEEQYKPFPYMVFTFCTGSVGRAQ